MVVAVAQLARVHPFVALPSIGVLAWFATYFAASGHHPIDQARWNSAPSEAAHPQQRQNKPVPLIPLYMPRTLDQVAAATATQTGEAAGYPAIGAPGAVSFASGAGGSGSGGGTTGSSHPTTAPTTSRRRGWLRREVRRIVQRDLARAASLSSSPLHGGLSPHAGMIEAQPGRRVDAMPEPRESPYRRERGTNGEAEAHSRSDAAEVRSAEPAAERPNPYAAAARIGRESYQGRPGFGGGGFERGGAFGRFGGYGARSFGGGHGHR